MSETHKRVGNAIAWVDLEPSNSQSESVGSAIVSYLQNLPECPDDSPTDDERGGWKVWALDRADEVIEAMGKAAIEEWYRGANRRGEPIEPVSDRLRTILNEVDPHSTCEEAADLLDEQAARIAEMEAEVCELSKIRDASCTEDPIVLIARAAKQLVAVRKEFVSMSKYMPQHPGNEYWEDKFMGAYEPLEAAIEAAEAAKGGTQ